MLYPSMDSDSKLAKAKKGWIEAETHFADSYSEQAHMSDVFHGRQWDDKDLRVLEDQGRPSLTFNLIASMVRQVVGLNADNLQQPVVEPSGAEDQFAADVWDSILANVIKSTKLEDLNSDVEERGFVEGECLVNMEVDHDPLNPLWAKVIPTLVPAREVAWDIGSRRKDRSDARCLYWAKWVDRDEFLQDYPEHKDKVDELFGSEDSLDDVTGSPGGTFGPSTMDDQDNYQYVSGSDGRWVNRRRGEIRVIHLEYKRSRRVTHAVDMQGNRTDDPEIVEALQQRKPPGVQFLPVWTEETYWFEFYESDVLYDGPSPLPYQGFSLMPFTVYVDSETGFAYGLVRALEDPQRDVNYSKSQEIEHMAQRGKEGYNAEVNAIPDVDAFEDAIEEGRTAIVAQDALAAGRVMRRDASSADAGTQQRLENAVRLLQNVAGIMESPENTARAVEAAATVALREKKALRSLLGVLISYRSFQRRQAMAVMETVIRAFPDDQIENYLADSEKYAVQNGVVFNKETGEGYPLRQLRDTRFDIDLQPSDTSDMARLTQFNILLAAKQAGVPVLDEELLRLASSSRSQVERLTEFAKQANQAQAQAQQEQTQLQMQLKAGELQTLERIESGKAQARFISDMAKTQATSASDEADRQAGLVESAMKAFTDLAKVWEQADDAEKQRIHEWILQNQAGQLPIQ